jgi:AraC family transcriptional regulator
LKTIINYEVKESTWPERVFLSKRAKVSFEKLSEFFTNSYGMIYRMLEEMKIDTTEPPFAIYYLVDEINKMTDLAAAVSISHSINPIDGLELIRLPASKVISVNYTGPYDFMAPAYESLEAYARDHGYVKDLAIEEYFSDPLIEKNPENWKTTIYFTLR